MIICQAGICILEEAGGATFGSKTSDLTGDASGELLCQSSLFVASSSAHVVLAGRKYLHIRGMPRQEVSGGGWKNKYYSCTDQITL